MVVETFHTKWASGMNGKNHTLRIAVEVRKKLEAGAVDQRQLETLYAGYTSVPRVSLFVKRARKQFPNLNCGLASVLLRHELQEGEVVNGKYGPENHTFLLLHGNAIVDITADQYGGPTVYVGTIQKPWALS